MAGLLVPSVDEAALAEAIHALLAYPGPARWLGQAACQRVAERFTPERQLHRLTALMEAGFGTPCETVRS